MTKATLEYTERPDGSILVFLRFEGCDVILGEIAEDRYMDGAMVKSYIDSKSRNSQEK